MNLLSTPPELAEWWTILQAMIWLDMDDGTMKQIGAAIPNEADSGTTLAEIWKDLDFCAQVVLHQGMESFDAECAEDYFGLD